MLSHHQLPLIPPNDPHHPPASHDDDEDDSSTSRLVLPRFVRPHSTTTSTRSPQRSSSSRRRHVRWTYPPVVHAMLTGNTMNTCEDMERMLHECFQSSSPPHQHSSSSSSSNKQAMICDAAARRQWAMCLVHDSSPEPSLSSPSPYHPGLLSLQQGCHVPTSCPARPPMQSSPISQI